MIVDEQLQCKTYEILFDATKKKTVVNLKDSWEFLQEDKEYLLKNKGNVFKPFAYMHKSVGNHLYVGKYYFPIFNDDAKLNQAEQEAEILPKRQRIYFEEKDEELIEGPLVDPVASGTMCTVSLNDCAEAQAKVQSFLDIKEN